MPKIKSNKKDAKAKADLKFDVPVKLKIVETKADETKGIIEAYVSIFENVDLVGDIIKQGAFADSLAKKLPKGVWGHDWNVPIAKTLEAKEDSKGLYIKAQFNLDTQRGLEAFSDIKFGIIDEFSIGFRVLDDEWTEDGIRIITKARLYEWSPVLVGANPDTELISVKSDKDKKEVEPKKVEDEKKPADEKKQVRKVDYIKVDQKKGQVKLYYRKDGKKKCEVLELSHKFKKYLGEQKALKAKVEANKGEANASQKTILRIRSVAKQNLKATQYLLKITK